jgi:hypothetical protein
MNCKSFVVCFVVAARKSVYTLKYVQKESENVFRTATRAEKITESWVCNGLLTEIQMFVDNN